MSKRYEVVLTCPKCSTQFNASLYRTLWIEDLSNRALVFEDKVNFVHCSYCKHGVQVIASLMCTNVPGQFAVWFDPHHSEDVGKMAEDFASAMGPTSFYATAPRISDWSEFKRTIERFERGELKGNAPQFNLDALKTVIRKSQPSFFDRLLGRNK